jgi:hypothetical protein
MIAKKLTYGRGLDPIVAQSVAGIRWGVKGVGLMQPVVVDASSVVLG